MLCNILTFSDLINGEFAITPKNTCAFFGELVELDCSLTTHAIQQWQGPYDLDISENHIINYKTKEKYLIFRSYHLLILNMDFTDAGTYKCIDSNDYNHTYNAEVIAIGRWIADAIFLLVQILVFKSYIFALQHGTIYQVRSTADFKDISLG